jgi:hypothetical protein
MPIFRRWRQAREERAERRRNAVVDRELYERAREIVDEEVAEVAREGRVAVEE